MSDWLKKQLERDKASAKIELEKQNMIDTKSPKLWSDLQAELKECVDMFRAHYPDGATYACMPANRIEIRRPDGTSALELVYDAPNRKISYVLRNQTGANEGVLDIDLNDRKGCYLRLGMERYETMDDVSAFLLGPLLYG